MLLEQLKELIDYGFVEKKLFEGYPLHVEYSLTDGQGRELFAGTKKSCKDIGIEYLKAQGKEALLIEKGVVRNNTYEKVGNLRRGSMWL